MLQLANEHGFDELYHDANGDVRVGQQRQKKKK
jgi:hypothetical protein